MSLFCIKCGGKNRDTSKFCSNCGIPLPVSSFPSGPLLSGVMLENRYKITSLIKTGGMGAVYKAIDDKLGCICAVKELVPPYGDYTQQAEATEWFKREVKILANLDHPNLPKVSDYFVSNGRYYLVMNFIEGEDLETKLLREGKPGLPVDKVVEWAKQLLQILDYLHHQKPPIVYRDIKPGNIMLHKDGRIMLIDFGIARMVHDAGHTKKTAVGTEGYAPPEQFRGQVEPRSDLYALGATMHHLLSGIAPIPFTFDPLRKLNSSIPERIEHIVIKSLDNKVSERFDSARDMLNYLEDREKIVIIKEKDIKVTGNTIQEREVFIPPDLNRMVLIPGSTFQMGYKTVTVNSFYIGKYPVTNKEYKLFNPDHKSGWSEPDYPVETVTWYDTIEYCNYLSDKEGLERCYNEIGNITMDVKKNGYRLPTEVEWEYACRAGSVTDFYWGENLNPKTYVCLNIDKYCWYGGNSGGKVHSVGQKRPNGWGLHDMNGNVWEWCWDWFDSKYYSNSSSNKFAGPFNASSRVLRGGSWYDSAGYCQSDCHDYISPDYSYFNIGFRLVRSV